MDTRHLNLGATYLGSDRCQFVVWAPQAKSVDLHVITPDERMIPLTSDERGYFQATVEGLRPGARYLYRLNGELERPDPASRFQPDGPLGPSQIVDRAFRWEDRHWFGLLLRRFITYELHVGTFTDEGTFDAIIPKLDALVDLGITAIELMPVAQFSGSRNWGYDGVCPFAVQNTYGGPDGLKRLVNACHQRGLAVVLDVVYSHLGPEGNSLLDFAPYLTDRYQTPWGSVTNFDGPHSDGVRRYFLENALTWLDEFHVDALRLDAVHAIFDFSAEPFIQALAAEVDDLADRLNRRIYLIAESDLNDSRLIRPREIGGYGLDAWWSDDFHHALHALLTGERHGYYEDFGRVEHFARSWRTGYTYTGDYSSFRKRRQGNSPRFTTAQQFVVCAQNHDQIGNRTFGKRLADLLCFEGLKVAAGAVILSPYLPLLFMGEEYGETAPFLYFVDYQDPNLAEAVREGRRKDADAEPLHSECEVPDPQAEATFAQSKLHDWLPEWGHQRVLRDFYRELIRLRREVPSLAHLSKEDLEVIPISSQNVLFVRRWYREDQVVLVFNFGETPADIVVPVPHGCWGKLLDSADEQWLGNECTLPTELCSEGHAMLRVPPTAVGLYRRVGG